MTPPSAPNEIRNRHGERLAFRFVHGAPDDAAHLLVVIGHGLTSDMDRPWSEALSEALAARGIASLRLAFSGNGRSEGEFADSTITKEVSDLGDALDACIGWRKGYVGHSMGGAVGMLRAAADERIDALVSLSAVTHTREFVDRMFGDLKPGEPMLGKPHCPFSPHLREDLHAYDTLAPRAADVRVPWLMVHGDADEVVPVTHSVDLVAAAGPNAELVRLPGVDHSFTGAGLSQLVDAVVPWLAAQLGS